MSTTWNAFPVLDRLLDDVARNGVGGAALGTAAKRSAFTPAVDVTADDDEIAFVCDVPGVQRDDLEITILGGTLTIKGERRPARGDRQQILLGRGHGTFERSFTLPELVDEDRMTADLADGVLTIRVPKRPRAKPRRIQIGGPREAAGEPLGEPQEKADDAGARPT